MHFYPFPTIPLQGPYSPHMGLQIRKHAIYHENLARLVLWQFDKLVMYA